MKEPIKKYNVFFRVDANRTIGSGHLVRCRLLAKQLKKENINSYFIYREIPDLYIQEMQNENFTCVKISETQNETTNIIEIINRFNSGNSLLITDSDEEIFYTKEFKLKIKNAGIRLMTITFKNNNHFYSDIVHNQNIMAPALSYSTEPYTVRLLGTEFVILDPQFAEIQRKVEINWRTKKNNVLISFGGSDKPDRTSLVYKLLQNFPGKIEKIIIIIGALYQYKNILEKLIPESIIETELFQNTDKMPYLMSESKYAITSGGLTAWELGVTKTLNIIISHSQRETISAKFLTEHNYAYYLGNISSLKENDIKNNLAVIFNNDDVNSKLVENLYKKINASGIEPVVEEIKKLLITNN